MVDGGASSKCEPGLDDATNPVVHGILNAGKSALLVLHVLTIIGSQGRKMGHCNRLTIHAWLLTHGS